MKYFFAGIACVMICLGARAQTPYIVTMEGQGKILNGIVSKYILQNDSAFKWYGTSESSYKVPVTVMNAMEAAKANTRFVIFGGTWCEDTQFILPKFFKLQQAAGVADDHISFFAVNREKKTLGNFAEAFNITNVPTIIVMRDGKEVGRVVEYGKTGKWDEELAALLQ